MDESDAATYTEELFLAAALKQRKPGQIHNGLCLNCGDPVSNSGVFCPEGCSDDYEKIMKFKARNGR